MEWDFNKSEESFHFDLTEWLINRDLTMGEIEEVKYLVKKSADDYDEDALLTLTLANNGVAKKDNHLAVKFTRTNFEVIPVGGYYTCLSVKSTDMTDFLNIDRDPSLRITPSCTKTRP